MNKPLTRRAREYFEVLDELHSEGYITHEEWLVSSPKVQANTPKITVRLLEDAMLEHGYSKGSPTEQKKYRMQWIRTRGIDIEIQNTCESESGFANHKLKSDPIFSAVDSFKKQLERKAREKADEAIRISQVKVTEVNERYAKLESDYNQLSKIFDETKKELNQTKRSYNQKESEFNGLTQRAAITKNQLKAVEKSFATYKEQEIKHHKEILELKDNQIKRIKHEMEELRKQNKSDYETLKEQTESQRQQLIVKLDNEKVERSKLENKHQKLEQENYNQKNVIRELNNKSKQLELDKKQFKKTLCELEKLSHKLEKEQAVLKTKNEGLAISLKEEKVSNKSYQKDLLLAREQLGSLRNQLEIVELELSNYRKNKNRNKRISTINKKST